MLVKGGPGHPLVVYLHNGQVIRTIDFPFVDSLDKQLITSKEHHALLRITRRNSFLSASRRTGRRRVFVCMVQKCSVADEYRSRHLDRCLRPLPIAAAAACRHTGISIGTISTGHMCHSDGFMVSLYNCKGHAMLFVVLLKASKLLHSRNRWNWRARRPEWSRLTLDASSNISWDQCWWFQFWACLSTCGGGNDD